MEGLMVLVPPSTCSWPLCLGLFFQINFSYWSTIFAKDSLGVSGREDLETGIDRLPAADL
eukprot:12913594-Prorocentrum_lima.AAC.1